MTTTEQKAEFKARFKRDPIAELGEPCPHGAAIDCEQCTAEAIVSLPPLRAERCREHLVDGMRVVKPRCSHSATTGRFGAALVCEACGFAGHQWTGYACGRRRPTPAEIEAEHGSCPIHERLTEQKHQRVPA